MLQSCHLNDLPVAIEKRVSCKKENLLGKALQLKSCLMLFEHDVGGHLACFLRKLGRQPCRSWTHATQMDLTSDSSCTIRKH